MVTPLTLLMLLLKLSIISSGRLYGDNEMGCTSFPFAYVISFTVYWRWIRKHKLVAAKSMARTVHFSRFTTVTCCSPVLAPICTSTKFHFQFQWTPISKLSAVAHVVHEQSFARQLQTVVSYELYDLNSERIVSVSAVA